MYNGEEYYYFLTLLWFETAWVYLLIVLALIGKVLI